MTKKSLIIALVIVAVAVLYTWSLYNSLINANESVDSQWAQVETQYQRRFDLIPNLEASVKGILKQEQKIFGDLADARSRYSGAARVQDKVNAANDVESALSRLLVIMENYPELKSAENVQTLMAQLEGTENRISVERQRFNDAVRKLNVSIKYFPANFLARMFGFSQRAYFQSAGGAENAPKINL